MAPLHLSHSLSHHFLLCSSETIASKLLIYYAICHSSSSFRIISCSGFSSTHPSSISSLYLGSFYIRLGSVFTPKAFLTLLSLFFLHPIELNNFYGFSSASPSHRPHTVCTIRFVGSWADYVQVGTCIIPVFSTVTGTWLDSIHILSGQMHGIFY